MSSYEKDILKRGFDIEIELLNVYISKFRYGGNPSDLKLIISYEIEELIKESVSTLALDISKGMTKVKELKKICKSRDLEGEYILELSNLYKSYNSIIRKYKTEIKTQLEIRFKDVGDDRKLLFNELVHSSFRLDLICQK